MKERIILRDIYKDFKMNNKDNTALSKFISLFSKKNKKNCLNVLNKLNLTVNEGEILGIIGRNGSGKSTILRIISRIYLPAKGHIKTSGKIIPLLDFGLDLKDRLSMRENIQFHCAFFGLTKNQTQKVFNQIVSFSELEKFVDTRIYQFSRGMRRRLIFSIVMHCNAKILLLDEVFDSSDEIFKQKSMDKLKEFAKKGGTVVLISHELEMLEKNCTRLIWLENGSVKISGNTKKLIQQYKNA